VADLDGLNLLCARKLALELATMVDSASAGKSLHVPIGGW